MGDFDGKVVVVTGAGRGLGRAFARGFAREGAKLVLVGRRLGPASDPETLAHTAGLIEAEGGEAICCMGSVDDLAAMQQMAYDAAAAFGGVDVLVNNAGVYTAESFSDTTLEAWNRTVSGFMTGVFVCAKVIAPLMIQRGGGHIINLGSGAATRADGASFAYGAVRAATLRMSVQMAADLERHGIAVNSYAPGFMRTERVTEVLGPGNARIQSARDPDESVPHVLWIARQPGVSFTGQVVYIDDWGKTWGDAGQD